MIETLPENGTSNGPSQTWVNWVRFSRRFNFKNVGPMGPGDERGILVYASKAEAEEGWRAFANEHADWVARTGVIYLGTRPED